MIVISFCVESLKYPLVEIKLMISEYKELIAKIIREKIKTSIINCREILDLITSSRISSFSKHLGLHFTFLKMKYKG